MQGKSKKRGLAKISNYVTQKHKYNTHLRCPAESNPPLPGSWNFDYEENFHEGTVKVYGVFVEKQERGIGSHIFIRRAPETASPNIPYHVGGVDTKEYLKYLDKLPFPRSEYKESFFRRLLRFFGWSI